MWSLNNALCNEQVQREIIAHAAAAIHKSGTLPSSPSLLGSRPSVSTSTPRNLSLSDLFYQEPVEESRTPRVAGYFQTVSMSESNACVLTWMVLASMCLFPECLKCISENTSASHKYYFLGSGTTLPFRDRIIEQLAGTEEKNAKTPLEIVLAEWQLYSRIHA